MSDNIHLPEQRYYNPIAAGDLMADGNTLDGRVIWTPTAGGISRLGDIAAWFERQGYSRIAPDQLRWVRGNAP